MTGQASILDIETRPDPEIAESVDWWTRIRDKIEAPSNYKDPVKIEGYRDKELLKAREKMALSARTGLVAMIGTEDFRNGDQRIHTNESLDRDGEKKALLEWIEYMPDTSRLIGWNHAAFDMPFLAGRCMLHGIDLPHWWPSPRDYRKVVDLMLLFGGSLEDWRFLLRGEWKDIGSRDTLTVSIEELEKHLRDDLRDTGDIARLSESAWRNR